MTRTAQDGSETRSAAIFADVAPPEAPLGEGSIALAERLGIPASPRTGGTFRASVEYVLFCGSGDGRPRAVAEIDAEVARLAAARRERDTRARVPGAERSPCQLHSASVCCAMRSSHHFGACASIVPRSQ